MKDQRGALPEERPGFAGNAWIRRFESGGDNLVSTFSLDLVAFEAVLGIAPTPRRK
jgi:hypothetical protein